MSVDIVQKYRFMLQNGQPVSGSFQDKNPSREKLLYLLSNFRDFIGYAIKLNIMNEFVLLFRLDILTPEAQPSPEQLKGYMKLYEDWVGGIAAQNKFIGGKGLSTEGRVLKINNLVTDGPFAEIKESVAGFITIRAKDLEEAVSITKNCPILLGEGNSVEIRQVTHTNGTK
jgi:hypothetical protein